MPTPPIPASCAHRPTVGGLVAPYANVRLADGGVDFRTQHTAKYEKCWRESRCQICGHRLPPTAVVFGGPNQLRALRFDEAPVCPPCALYAAQACPMIAGRMPRYATRRPVSAGKRGRTCSTPGCDCAGWVDTDPDRPHLPGGDPAHPWYACWVPVNGWDLTGNHVRVLCEIRGCDERHERLVINGLQLHNPPRKIMLVSAPGAGRQWTRISYTEATAD